MQLVTASLTAVFNSESTLTGGSSWAMKEDTVSLANPSLMLLAGKTHFISFTVFSARLAISVAPFNADQLVHPRNIQNLYHSLRWGFHDQHRVDLPALPHPPHHKPQSRGIAKGYPRKIEIEYLRHLCLQDPIDPRPYLRGIVMIDLTLQTDP
jgi:hypothetical protein